MLRVAIVAVATVWATRAHASIVTYLPVLTDEYGFQGGCVVCHEGPNGGEGTITKPFGKSLMRLGLVGQENTQKLRDVMQSLDEEQDSDGDGHSDLDELALAGDPNDPAIGPGGYTPVEYGCSIVNAVGHSTPDRGGDPLAFMLSTLVAISLLLDRRRRRRRA